MSTKAYRVERRYLAVFAFDSWDASTERTMPSLRSGRSSCTTRASRVDLQSAVSGKIFKSARRRQRGTLLLYERVEPLVDEDVSPGPAGLWRREFN
jgi:hypothetical protein